jgi:hypothetical protein
MKKIAIYLIIAAVAYYFLDRYLKHRKYYNFFRDLGFGDKYLAQYSQDELFTSWNYIVNYVRKGITLTPNVDPELYAKVKAVNDKYHNFTTFK